MKALTWQGKRDVQVRTVPDPVLVEPTDALIEVTSTAICGSDLHLYEVLGPFLKAGDILGHEAMGIVREVGSGVEHLTPGDRVVIPFNISCGHCYMCSRGLMAACETTQVRDQGKGAALFGYTEMYGSVPGGQAELLRVPQAQFGPIRIGDDHPDERYLYLSDILPTAWQGVDYTSVPEGGTLAVFGLGPVGQLAVRIAKHRGLRVIAVDRVEERLALAAQYGAETIDLTEEDDAVTAVLDRTDGRGADGCLDAVGMEAHGSPVLGAAVRAVGVLPGRIAKPLTKAAGVDRLAALLACIGAVRRGGTVSVTGVYGGRVDPLPMMDLFDKGVTMRMGQCHVKRWIDDLMPIVEDPADPLGLESLATHRLPLDEAPEAYRMFQQKHDGCIKVVLTP